MGSLGFVLNPNRVTNCVVVNYNSETYTLRLMQSIEKYIVYESLQHKVKGYEPDDIAQELRIHIYNKIHLYDPTNASFRTWAQTVMRNKIIDLADLRSDWLDPTNAHQVLSIHEEVEYV